MISLRRRSVIRWPRRRPLTVSDGEGVGVLGLPRTGVAVRNGRRQDIHGRIPPRGRRFLVRKELRRRPAMATRSRRVFGLVVRICILHGGIGVGDIIPASWSCDRRRRHGDGLGGGRTDGRNPDAGAGSLKGLVCIANWWLGVMRLTNVLGWQLLGVRYQSIIEPHGSAHSIVLILVVGLPLRIHFLWIFFFLLLLFSPILFLDKCCLESEEVPFMRSDQLGLVKSSRRGNRVAVYIG